MITLSKKKKTHTHTVGLLWASDLPVAETSTCITYNTHNRQTSMTPAEYKPATPTSEKPQTHALDHAATGIGPNFIAVSKVKRTTSPINNHVTRIGIGFSYII
jgi:hypothetical protein